MNNIIQLAIAYIVPAMAVHWIFMKVLKIAKVKGLLVFEGTESLWFRVYGLIPL